MEKTYKVFSHIDQSFSLLKRTVSNYIRLKKHYLSCPMAPSSVIEKVAQEIKVDVIPEEKSVENYYEELVGILFGAEAMVEDSSLIDMDVVDEAMNDFLLNTRMQKQEHLK